MTRSNYAVVTHDGKLICWAEQGNMAIAIRDEYDKNQGNPRFTSMVLTSGQYAAL